MEELGWERNISFPWSNINHHQQQLHETFIFGTENIFLDPIQDLPKPGSSPVPAAGSHHDQLLPAINVASSSFGSASQHWHQTLTVNGLHEGKNVIPLTSLEHTTSPDQEDNISLIFSNHKNLSNKIIKNLSDVVSSDGSVTKESEDESSSEKKPNNGRSRSKRPRSDPGQPTSSVINFQQLTESEETDSEVVAQMKEMIYRAAAFRPVSFTDDEVAEKPRRKNVRISNDPQTVAARKRRERISERIRVLQKLVPGGDKMDTASMLDEAANYLKFLRSQVKVLEQFGQKVDYVGCGTTTSAYSTIHNVTFGVPFSMQTPFLLPHQQVYPNLPPA